MREAAFCSRGENVEITIGEFGAVKMGAHKGAAIRTQGLCERRMIGETHDGWNAVMDNVLNHVGSIHGGDFEIVKSGTVSTNGL